MVSIIYFHDTYVLDSEWNDECIDFTMMYVLFVSVYTISSRNNALIFNFSILFDGKVNIVCNIYKGTIEPFLIFVI